jgi:hypothetical protein
MIREKCHHIAVLGGPQYAAFLWMRDVEGKLYVSELNQWLWSPRSGLASRILTDQELEGLLSPLEVCRTLLLSAEDTMIQLIHQMDCVQARVHTERTWCSESGISQADLIIGELFRLQIQSVSLKSTGMM